MSIEAWIRSTFIVVEDGWVHDDGTTEAVFKFNGTQARLPWFVSTFGSVSAPPTLVALKAVDPDDDLGWYQHFETWKDQGIIS